MIDHGWALHPNWEFRWRTKKPTANEVLAGVSQTSSATVLAAGLLDLRATLANLELRIALADHVNATAAFNDLAIGVTVLQGTNAANHFHRENSLRYLKQGRLVNLVDLGHLATISGAGPS